MSARFHLNRSGTLARSRSCPSIATDIHTTTPNASTGFIRAPPYPVPIPYSLYPITSHGMRRQKISDEWPDFGDEQLFDIRLADLPLRIEGTLASRIDQLRGELA